MNNIKALFKNSDILYQSPVYLIHFCNYRESKTLMRNFTVSIDLQSNLWHSFSDTCPLTLLKCLSFSCSFWFSSIPLLQLLFCAAIQFQSQSALKNDLHWYLLISTSIIWKTILNILPHVVNTIWNIMFY